MEYKRTVRLEPYETMTVGLIQEGEGNENDRQAMFIEVSAQVEVWIEEAKHVIKEAAASG